MVDLDAVNLVREALKSGKTENEVVVLMKQAGYIDVAISEILAVAKRGVYPADELARRIAEKNNIPLQQTMPKLGPPTIPSQPPLMQPMPVPVSNIDKNIIAMFKLSIDAFLHPAETSKKIKGSVSMGDGAKLIGLCGIAVALIISIFILVGMLLLGTLASAVASIDMSMFFVSWIIGTIVMLFVVPIAMLIGWVIGAGILWISAKVLGGTRSYSEFAAEMVFPQVGISLVNIAVIIIEFIIFIIIALNAAASLMSSLSSGGIFGIFSAFAAFTSTMVIGGIITGLISLVVGIYALYVLVVFIKESMEMSTIKAIIAIFLPLVAVIIIGAVIASVMAWYWFMPLTNTPPSGTYNDGGGTATQYAPTILMSYRNSTHDGCMSMDIRNSGGTTILSDTIFDIYTIGGVFLGSHVVVRSELNPGETGNFDIVSSPFNSDAKSSVPIGSYFLRLSLFNAQNVTSSDIYFTC
jgi:hypothetical protein